MSEEMSDIFIKMKIICAVLITTCFLCACSSPKLIHENQYSVTYEHRDDKFSNLNNPSYFIESAKKDALKKCQEKRYQSVRVTNSQCTNYCSRNEECVCITNFVCK